MLTIKPIKKAIREMNGIKVSDFQDQLEDLLYSVTRIPRNIKYWYKCKFTKTKVVIEDLHGGWWDTDHKILHAMFQLLVDYVEKELAHSAKYSFDKEVTKNKTSRELGEMYLLHEYPTDDYDQDQLEHLKEQKAKDRKVLELYRWWKDTRKSRVEVYDTEEYKSLSEQFEPYYFKPLENGCSQMMTLDKHPLYPQWKEMMDKSHKQDDEWREEDTAKLKELIDIRHNLWT